MSEDDWIRHMVIQLLREVYLSMFPESRATASHELEKIATRHRDAGLSNTRTVGSGLKTSGARAAQTAGHLTDTYKEASMLANDTP